jgi:hypothetical protein
MVQPATVNIFKMAQHVVLCQTFWSLGRGAQHAGQNFTCGLMSRLSLQVGHLTFMSLILLSLPMGGRTVSWNHLVSEDRSGKKVWQGETASG